MAPELKSLIRLVSTLQRNEPDIIREYIITFSKYNRERKNALMYLFDQIVSGAYDSYDKYTTSSGGKEPFSTLLFEQLREVIYECIVLEFNVAQKGAYSEPVQALFDIRTKLNLAHVLHSRGLLIEVEALLEDAVQSCYTYGLYGEAIAAKTILYTMKNRVGLTESAAIIEEELNQLRKLRYATELGETYFNKFVYRQYRTGNPESYSTDLRNCLDELGALPETYISGLAKYCYLHLNTLYSQSIKDYEHMKEHAYAICKHLDEYPALRSKPKHINSNLLLADACVFNSDLHAAIEILRNCRSVLVKGNQNYNELLLHEALLLIYAGKYEAAGYIVADLISRFQRTEVLVVPLNKIQFYHCNLLFMQEQYRKAYEESFHTTSFSYDKEGWNLAQRILHCMLCIETRRWDDADREISNLARTLRNIRRKHPVTGRSQLIVNLLQALVRRSFNFSEAAEGHSEELEKLASREYAYRWDFLIPEIIPFHKWMMNRARKIKTNEGFFDQGNSGA